MVTVDVAAAQVPFVTVHVKVFAPTTKPVTPDVDELGVVIVAPEDVVHAPVPTVVVAFKLVVVTLHKFCTEPAFDCDGALTLMVTFDVAAAQAPFVTVHVKVFAPTDKPVTPDVDELGVVIVAPEDVVHAPVPTVVVAFRLAVVTLHKFCTVPAFDCDGALTLIVTFEVVAAHPDLVTVHVNTSGIPATKPVTVEVGLLIEVTVPVPLATVHVPVPPKLETSLPAKVVEVTLHKFWEGPASAFGGQIERILHTVISEVF
jgi:hypothetical protein